MRFAVMVGLAVFGVASAAQAADTGAVSRQSDPWGLEVQAPYVRFEADAVAMPGVWPTPSIGGDVAVVAGRPAFHARAGVGAMGSGGFTLGERGKVASIVETSDLRVCTASHRWVHRLRLCAGAQAGVMHLRWRGYAEPGRRDLPWFAVVGGGDYAVALGRVVDLHAGIGLGIPIVGQELVARSRDAVDEQRSGTFFSTFRLGLGFRLG